MLGLQYVGTVLKQSKAQHYNAIGSDYD